jgi:hypothetical protein
MTTVQQLALSKTPCVRDHTIPGVHFDGCVDTVCTGCQPAEARYGLLCGACYFRMWDWLRDGHALVMNAFDRRTPGLGSSVGRSDRVDSSRTWRLPFDEDAVDATDTFFGQLADVVKNHARELHVAPPGFLFDRWRRDEDVPGFPQGTDLLKADVLLSELIRFEFTHASKIANLYTIVVWYDELESMVKALRGRFPIEMPKPRPSRLECKRGGIGCGSGPVNVTQTSDGFEAKCHACGWQPADVYVYAAEAV